MPVIRTPSVSSGSAVTSPFTSSRNQVKAWPSDSVTEAGTVPVTSALVAVPNRASETVTAPARLPSRSTVNQTGVVPSSPSAALVSCGAPEGVAAGCASEAKTFTTPATSSLSAVKTAALPSGSIVTSGRSVPVIVAVSVSSSSTA